MAHVPLGLSRRFRNLHKPRRVNRCQHRLLDIIALTICAVIANADDWQGAETFGKGGGDYLLTVKGAQQKLRDQIEACFVRASDQDMAGVDHDYPLPMTRSFLKRSLPHTVGYRRVDA